MKIKSINSSIKNHDVLSVPPLAYTFIRWYNGEFFLDTCATTYLKGINRSTGVPESKIEIEELKLIRTEQKNIFESKLKDKNIEFEKQFLQSLENSRFKKELIINNINKGLSILSATNEVEFEIRSAKRITSNNINKTKDIINDEKNTQRLKKSIEEQGKSMPKYHHLKCFDLTFEFDELKLIREYASEYLFKGKTHDCKFIHSPKFSNPNTEIENCYIYSHALSDHIEFMKSTLDSLGQTINFEKVKKLSNNLMKYGFFDLPKLKQLSRKQQRTLLSHFIHSDYNYILAGLYHLGFIDVLLNAFPKSKIKAFKLLGSLFDYDPDGSNGRHNIAIIKDAKTHARHTSYQFIKQFADYYEKLKQG